jgi:predicted transcriptional regulator
VHKINKILELRKWESEHLPLCNRTIGYAVFAYIAGCLIQERSSTVKELVNSLSEFSRAGIYLQLKRLESDGWITFENGVNDGRNKHIVPTAAFAKLIDQYASRVRKILSNE